MKWSLLLILMFLTACYDASYLDNGMTREDVKLFCNERGYKNFASNPDWVNWKCGRNYEDDYYVLQCYGNITYYDDGSYEIDNEKYRCYNFNSYELKDYTKRGN